MVRIANLVLLGLAWLPGPAARAALPYLHVAGTSLVTPAGAKVVLRGYNLGAWLTTEGWMDGSTGAPGRDALERLESRFGVSTAASLMNIWRKSWVTTADLDLLRS